VEERIRHKMPKEKKYAKIAIDGPAGAGKSTVTREVSRRLELKYLDTGAMYRAITLKLIEKGIDLNDLARVKEVLDKTEIKLNDRQEVFLDGKDVTGAIREAEVNRLVSPVSAISLVRRRLVDMQKAIASESNGIVMEGRDIASRVMPDADFKFYLDASIEERARRRRIEQLGKGNDMTEDEVIAEIKNRDIIDSGREDSPLTRVDDAIVIDTTDMAFEAVVDKLVNIVKSKVS